MYSPLNTLQSDTSRLDRKGMSPKYMGRKHTHTAVVYSLYIVYILMQQCVCRHDGMPLHIIAFGSPKRVFCTDLFRIENAKQVLLLCAGCGVFLCGLLCRVMPIVRWPLWFIMPCYAMVGCNVCLLYTSPSPRD